MLPGDGRGPADECLALGRNMIACAPLTCLVAHLAGALLGLGVGVAEDERRPAGPVSYGGLADDHERVPGGRC